MEGRRPPGILGVDISLPLTRLLHARPTGGENREIPHPASGQDPMASPISLANSETLSASP
jgi:hypothetical protein